LTVSGSYYVSRTVLTDDVMCDYSLVTLSFTTAVHKRSYTFAASPAGTMALPPGTTAQPPSACQPMRISFWRDRRTRSARGGPLTSGLSRSGDDTPQVIATPTRCPCRFANGQGGLAADAQCGITTGLVSAISRPDRRRDAAVPASSYDARPS